MLKLDSRRPGRRLGLLVWATFSVNLLFSTMLLAQSTSGTAGIRGIVDDQNGSPVAGAKVTITNKATAFVVHVTTSSSGVYSSGPLQPGEYNLRVEAKGFKKGELEIFARVAVTVGGNFGFAACGSMAGSGGVIVMDDTRDMVWALNNINEFYAHESCGQCTPCREGSLWMKKITQRMLHGGGVEKDTDTLKSVADNIAGRTICAFGEACAWPTQSFIDKFRDEFVATEGKMGHGNGSANH